MSLSQPRELSMSEIEGCAADYQADLQRELERKIRQKDLSAALAVLQAKEYVQTFVFNLKLRSTSQLQLAAPRRRPIHIPQAVRAWTEKEAARGDT